jgi:hypothetical protein
MHTSPTNSSSLSFGSLPRSLENATTVPGRKIWEEECKPCAISSLRFHASDVLGSGSLDSKNEASLFAANDADDEIKE